MEKERERARERKIEENERERERGRQKWNRNSLISSSQISNEAYLPLPTYPAALVLDTYGMGWWMGTYRGHPMQEHAGDVSGSASHVSRER
jgi:hypothetical protein